MRIDLKSLTILFFIIVLNKAYSQTYFKTGIFDYKHQTGGLILNKKNVKDNSFEIFNIGELYQISEISGIIDKGNNFSRGKDLKKREEYAIYLSSGIQKSYDLSDNLMLVPSFSVGVYQQFDEGKDMGFPIQFKSELASFCLFT